MPPVPRIASLDPPSETPAATVVVVESSAVLTWVLALTWFGAAVWVYFDSTRSGRNAWANAIATFVLPGVGLAVYLGTRGAERRDRDDAPSANGERLLVEMTAEVERLRRELAESRAELEALHARK